MSVNQTDVQDYYSESSLERNESRSLMEMIPLRKVGRADSAAATGTEALSAHKETGKSSTCETPRVQHMLHNSAVVSNSLPGTRHNVTATIFSLPLIWAISKSNWLRNSSQRILRRCTPALD